MRSKLALSAAPSSFCFHLTDNYGQGNAGKTVQVYEKRTRDGTFEFRIQDSYGDGLCCANGGGSYTIFYGDSQITSLFPNPSKEETLPFGSSSKCEVSLQSSFQISPSLLTWSLLS